MIRIQIIVVLSTVTTTFLDVYSAGISLESISKKLKSKYMQIVVCILGIGIAFFAPGAGFEGFLYLIGSVFAPMTAILITDYFILKKDSSDRKVNIINFIIWIIGFGIYRVFMRIDTPFGSTLPVMIIVAIICILINFIKNYGGRKNV